MFKLSEFSLEWAIQHLCRYCDSDCFPRIPEFIAIKSNWTEVRRFILDIDLKNHVPHSPVIHLAPKPNGLYRIVQRLSPVDAIIYTALVYEIHEIIENYRIPASEGIACSYRIKPDVKGSFFGSDDNGWITYNNRTHALAEKHKDGYVLLTDITDFYNQIYVHRINNIIGEAGAGAFDEHAEVIERFLMNLYTKTSKGIPIGPAASIVLSEAILGDIDNKILKYTRDFTRWVDDTRIFFPTKAEADHALYCLTDYLYRSHRLVFSGEKTKIMTCKDFLDNYFLAEDHAEADGIRQTKEAMALTKVIEDCLADASPYADPESVMIEAGKDADKLYKKMAQLPEFDVTSKAYLSMLTKELTALSPNFPLLRRLYRGAAMYRFRNILSLTLHNFEKLLPIVREVVVYLRGIHNLKAIQEHFSVWEHIWNSDYAEMPYINNWLCYLFEAPAFRSLNLPKGYDRIVDLRNQAFIAAQRKDVTWVKSYRDGIDTLPDWDKRGVLFALSALSNDEMCPVLEVEAGRGGIVEKSIAQYLKSR